MNNGNPIIPAWLSNMMRKQPVQKEPAQRKRHYETGRETPAWMNTMRNHERYNEIQPRTKHGGLVE